MKNIEMSEMKCAFIKAMTLAVQALFLIVPTAQAQSNVAGYWVCNYNIGASVFPQDLTLSQIGSDVTGEGGYVETESAVFTVTGTVVGTQFDFYDDYIGSSYAAGSSGTVNGNTIAGTWGDTNGLTGTFDCARGAAVSPTPVPTVIPTAIKRATAATIFCNRVGLGLSTAACTVSVADKGAPPRVSPVGSVSFFASGGFAPSAGSCTLQATAFSPGIASCSFNLAVPAGFAIGVKFPIEAQYTGNQTYASSATSHQLIFASCVGTPSRPCSGAVALNIVDAVITKNTLKTIASCGSVRKRSARPDTHTPGVVPGLNKASAGSCAVIADMEAALELLIEDFDTVEEWRALSDSISPQEAAADPVLLKIKEIGARSDAALLQTLQNSSKLTQEMQKANEKYMRDKLTPSRRRLTLKPQALPAVVRQIGMSFGSAQTIVGAGKQRPLNIRLNRRGLRILSVFKRVGVHSLPLRMKVTQSKAGVKARTVRSAVQTVQVL